MLLTVWSLCPKNERQRSVNDLRPSILENHGAMHLQCSKIILPAAYLGKYPYDRIIAMSQNECQRSVNDFCAGILDDITQMECS